MAFVKLDCGILNSSLWDQMAQRNVFITALLMARPYEMKAAMQAIEVDSLLLTKLIIPAGFYGLVEAAGIGIIRMAGIALAEGMCALKALCDPDDDSRSSDFEGRRMARIDGGFIILNYQRYRDKDHTAAERMKRYREQLALRRNERNEVENVTVLRRNSGVTDRNVTQAEAEAETLSLPHAREAHLPSIDEVKAYAQKIGLIDWVAEMFFNDYEGVGWIHKGVEVGDWRALLRNKKVWWEADGRPATPKQKGINAKNQRNHPGRPIDRIGGADTRNHQVYPTDSKNF